MGKRGLQRKTPLFIPVKLVCLDEETWLSYLLVSAVIIGHDMWSLLERLSEINVVNLWYE